MRIDLGYWPLGEFVAQGEDLVMKIIFQLVLVQPALTDVDPRICQYCSYVGYEYVSDFSASDTREERPGQRDEKRESPCQDRRSVSFSSFEHFDSTLLIV